MKTVLLIDNTTPRLVSRGIAFATSAIDFNSAYDLTPYATDNPPIVPDGIYNIDLAGQLAGIPGGSISPGSSFISDPSGIGAVYTDPTVNPNPTGGWMLTLASLAQSASTAFQSYERGSPSVATPAPRAPLSKSLGGIFQGSTAPGGGIGPFSWTAIAVIVVGGAALVVFAHHA